MDGSIIDHSDSDSGESWTILDPSPVFADDAPLIPADCVVSGSGTIEKFEKDEDTDGISIISDSDPETSSHGDNVYDINYGSIDDRPTETQIPQFILTNSLSPNNPHDHDPIKDENDFLGDNNGKLRTYVHRRNKRLSTMLNIIVLGSIITAAGVAIGHMWGVRDDCSLHSTQSVNKILSNLYKLQEENAYLRSKLREFTITGNLPVNHKKLGSSKLPPKRCKKIFEEPLTNKNVDRLTKCVDFENSNTDKVLEGHLVDPDFEKEYLSDLSKLKKIYNQNKSWLDEEINKRLKQEEISQKRLRNKLKTTKENKSLKKDDEKILKEQNFHTSVNPDNEASNLGSNINDDDENKKVTYADSLKVENQGKRNKRDIAEVTNYDKKSNQKRKLKVETDFSMQSLSEENLKKDNRFTEYKFKAEKKKHDRQRHHKKQKRKNKYEQWEMKGGYMKDYDDNLSVTSQETDNILKSSESSNDMRNFNTLDNLSELNSYVVSNPYDNENNLETKSVKQDKGEWNDVIDKNADWYENRGVIRSEARRKLEKELFGDGTPNTAAWYFRRMHRREHCRIKGDNSTRKKNSKKMMNFKTKH